MAGAFLSSQPLNNGGSAPIVQRQVFLSRSRSNVLADIVPFLCRRVRAQVCKIVMIPCDSARKFVNTAWIDHT